MRIRSSWLLSVMLVGLSGCGSGDLFGPSRNAFPPLCPEARLIPAVADLRRFAVPGPRHDLTDLILSARVTSVQGSCKAGDDKSITVATLQVTITVQRGPAMKGREADLPVFLAVTQGEVVRDKRIFAVRVVFPPNVDRLTITSPDLTLNLPVGGKVSGASYSVIAGFQLTPQELEANRQAGDS